MVVFVICGQESSRNLVHAIHIARYLQNNLPDFTYQTIEVEKYDWRGYLSMLNIHNGWHFTSGPVIWKKLSETDQQKYLIGGLSEFWEYCYDYYGVESRLSKEDLDKFVEICKAKSEEIKSRTNSEDEFIIGIVGTRNCILMSVLERILKLEELRRGHNKIIIKLYEYETLSPEEKISIETKIEELLLGTFSNDKPVIEIATFLTNFLQNTDLIIFLDNFKKDQEKPFQYYNRIAIRMFQFADAMDYFGKNQVRVIFSCAEMGCLLAHILIRLTINIKPYNVVCVTCDQSLQYIQAIKHVCNVPSENLSASPVWGFTSTDIFVDLRSTFFKTDVVKPFQRALTAPKGSTLPLGTVSTELRVLSYLIEDEEHVKQQFKQNWDGNELNGNKVEALMSLLKLWYAEEQHDNIISLGVCSDGTHGIPKGLVFSQPVIMETKRRWRPFKDFPINETSKERINKVVKECVTILEQFDLF